MGSTNLLSRRVQAAALAVLCVAEAATGYAAAYSCSGNVVQLATAPNGDVNASFVFPTGNMLRERVCNVDQTVDDVSVSSCKTILATLLTAQATQRTVTIWFDNASGGSCAANSWVTLRGVGWYFGPSIE